jgi:large subunit ribosomal protein L30
MAAIEQSSTGKASTGKAADKKSSERKAVSANKIAAKKVAAKIASAQKNAAKKAAGGKTLKVTLVRSVINTRDDHRAAVRGLGLRRLNHTVELEDTPAVRGMINKVIYLLRLEG